MTKKLAEELKEARLNRDITLQQLFVKTRIDIKFLEAIEAGNFDVLPDVYLRAFVKSYASAVGLDENVIMKKFDAARAGKDYEERRPAESPQAEREEKTHEHKPHEHKPEKKKEYMSYEPAQYNSDEGSSSVKKGNQLIWIVAAAVVIIIGLAVYFLFFRSSTNQIIQEKPYEEYLDKGTARFEDTVKTDTTSKIQAQQAPGAQTAAVNDSLTLRIKTTDSSWIQVQTDNGKTSEYILKNNQKTVRALRNFKVTVGNSGSVQFFLNDRQLNFTGRPKERRVVRIDSTGLAVITQKPKSTTGNTQ